MLRRLVNVVNLILPETAVSCGGAAPELPAAPGLHVCGSPVPLPVDQRGLKQIQALAVSSPHGRGLRTVLDPAVRSSKELEPQQFSIEHPSWSSCIKALATRAVTALSGNEVPAQSVVAIPYKLLLYSPGDHFLVHRDTEKEPGMRFSLARFADRCRDVCNSRCAAP
jgi:hypothetical protein